MTEKIALVFSGIGTHWTGMAESLLVNDAVFRDTITEVDALLTPLQGWSVLTLLSGRPAGVAPERPEIAHPAIFSVQIGLTRCLLARGVRPVAVIGHSAGEVAAAWCAGALTLAEAVQVVAAQSALISAVDAGAMLHVALDPASLARRIEAADTGLELAAINSPLAAVVAGPPEAIAAFEASLRADAIDTRLLGIRVPLHTRAVEPQQAAFTARLAGLRAQRPGIAFYSSLRGALAQEGDFDAAYWARHIRDTVRFPDAAEALFEAGVTRCIEVSPHPALLQHLSTIAGTRAAAITFEPTLQRDMPEPLWPGAASGSAEAAPDAALDAATVERALRASAADILGAGFAFDLQRQHTWIDIGCTSLQITRLMARLSELLGKRLSITLPYRFPTPAALIAGLSAAVSAHEQTRPAPDASASIAIVGMACRLPGGANDPAALWDLLSSGTDPITEIPPERWPAAAFYDADPSVKGRSVSRWGGFISGQDLRDFDARHFRMTPREAGALDPQQRLLLEVTWEALENAGYSVPELKGTQVGVYVALSTDDYKNSTLYHDIDALDPYAGAGAPPPPPPPPRPAACPTTSAGKARTWQSTPPVPAPSWHCTWPARRSSRANATSPWSAASMRCSRHTCMCISPRPASCRRPAAATCSTMPPTAMCGPKAAACWYCSASRTPCATHARCARACSARPSTRMAPAAALAHPMARPSKRSCARPGARLA